MVYMVLIIFNRTSAIAILADSSLLTIAAAATMAFSPTVIPGRMVGYNSNSRITF